MCLCNWTCLKWCKQWIRTSQSASLACSHIWWHRPCVTVQILDFRWWALYFRVSIWCVLCWLQLFLLILRWYWWPYKRTTCSNVQLHHVIICSERMWWDSIEQRLAYKRLPCFYPNFHICSVASRHSLTRFCCMDHLVLVKPFWQMKVLLVYWWPQMCLGILIMMCSREQRFNRVLFRTVRCLCLHLSMLLCQKAYQHVCDQPTWRRASVATWES